MLVPVNGETRLLLCKYAVEEYDWINVCEWEVKRDRFSNIPETQSYVDKKLRNGLLKGEEFDVYYCVVKKNLKNLKKI